MPEPISVVKRSPIVLIRTLVLIELIFLAVFLLGTFPDRYKLEVFNKLPLSKFFSYSTFKIFFLFSVQFVITVYAFLRWYYESYAVFPSSISHRWGVFFRRNKSIPLDKSMAVTASQGPLGKLLHYGSIHIQNGPKNKSMNIADIPRHCEFERIIQQAADHRSFRRMPDVRKLLAAEEHEALEFKSSLRVDIKSGQKNKSLEKAAMKTIAAFLNTKGGHLVIGVDDRRKPVGLHYDYKTIQRPDADGFENHFTQLFNSMIGPDFRHLVKLWFHSIDDAEICIIQVSASPRPVYLTSDGNEEFFVRTGNITTSLKLSEIDVYKRSRWQ